VHGGVQVALTVKSLMVAQDQYIRYMRRISPVVSHKIGTGRTSGNTAQFKKLHAITFISDLHQ
jgi:hypothetical protein